MSFTAAIGKSAQSKFNVARESISKQSQRAHSIREIASGQFPRHSVVMPDRSHPHFQCFCDCFSGECGSDEEHSSNLHSYSIASCVETVRSFRNDAAHDDDTCP